MLCTIADHYAVAQRPRQEIQLYIANVGVIDQLRTSDLAAAGLPDAGQPTMLALWRRAQGIRARAKATGFPEDLASTPFLFYVDPVTGGIIWTFESSTVTWSEILIGLRSAEVRHG